jgi:hypothetical protein
LSLIIREFIDGVKKIKLPFRTSGERLDCRWEIL